MCVELLIYCFRFFNLAISNLPILFLLLFCFSTFLLFCFFYCLGLAFFFFSQFNRLLFVGHFCSSFVLLLGCYFSFWIIALRPSPPPPPPHTHSLVYSPPPLPTYLPTHTRIKRGCSSWWRQRTKTLKTQI